MPSPSSARLDLSIGQRLALGFGACAVLLAGVVALALHGTTSIVALRARLTDVVAPRAAAVDALERDVLYRAVRLRNATLLPTPEHLASCRAAGEALRRDVARLQALPLGPEEQPLVARLAPALERYAAAGDALLATGADLRAREAAAAAAREDLLDVVRALADVEDHQVEAARADIAAAAARTRHELQLLVPALLALLGATALWTARGVRTPVRALVGAARGIGAGDHRAADALRAPPARRDELAELTRAFRAMSNELREREERLRQAAAELQQRSEVIQAQNEKLQAQQEEIQSQNEELQSQNEELHAQAEELTAQGDELQRTVEELALGERRKDDFLAVLSHELRNPLTPIRNGLYILDHAPADSPQARTARAIVQRQVAHLTRLVDDLLDVTRIARGKIQIEQRPVDLGRVLRDVAEDHRAQLAAAGLAFDVRLPDAPAMVSGDAARLAQVAGNLLHNAAKFTPPGGRVELTLARSDDGRAVILRVADTGVGVEPAFVGRMFDAFAQAESTLARSRGGLGLGLALARSLVEHHGGRIEARSEGAGHGTEVIVTLPAAARADAGAPADAAPVAGAVTRRVLVIDDAVDAANSLADALQLGGHQVDVAFDGPAGLARARAARPDVVLCDIGLPGMTGYDVARAFRADAALRDVFLVALTGYALADDLRRAAEAGFDQHVAKPPAIPALEALLASVPARPQAR